MTVDRFPIVDRASWLAMRLHNINASEVAVACGEGAYGSLAELYAEKKGLRPPLVDTGLLRRGRWGEASVFEALAEERPDWTVVRAKIYLCDRELRLGCTPDGFATSPDYPGRGIVQAKTVARSVFRRRWLDDPDTDIATGEATLPTHYRLQVVTEMMLSDCSWGVLAAIVTSEWDNVLRIFHFERDAELELRIVDHVAAFWSFWFDPGIMPPFNPQRDAELIRQLFPEDDGTEIDLRSDNRVAQLVEDLTETQKARKRLTSKEIEIKAELQGKLGDHTYGQLADGRCLQWKMMHRRAHTVKAADFRAFRILMRHKHDDDDEGDE